MNFDFSTILRNCFTGISRRIISSINWIAQYYTPLAVIVISIVGGILIVIGCYLGRYNFYNYWNWKQRAFRKVFFFILTLVLLKLFIRR